MKHILLILITLLLALNVSAQAPQGVNYQAVVRDAAGSTVNNKAVKLRMRILQGSATGTVVYSETFSPTTSALGLVNVVIGQGTPLTGSFSGINWSTGVYFLEMGVDITGGSNFTVLGTQQFVSVPYALYAAQSGSGPAGKNTLVKTTAEAAGSSTTCPRGGVKLEYGLDANGNGVLEVSEINATLTQYVCNGLNGNYGPQGIAGKNSLVKTTLESAGPNCMHGGMKVEYGLDNDKNGVLDAVEVNAT